MPIHNPAAAPPEKRCLEVGFLRLTDAAPLILAEHLGCYERLGLDVVLSRETTWASVRDKLVTGGLDAAQMLAPLPPMTAFGASGLRVRLVTGLLLSRNGNAVTLRHDLWHRVRGAASIPAALGQLLRKTGRPLTFATVHAFSTHTLLLRRWLQTGAIDPDRDVRMIVVPPAQMVDTLQSGIIDGFCVGEPWNTVAQASATGCIAATGSEIWPGAPEKVLSVSAAWHARYPNTHLRLRIALYLAMRWLAVPANLESTAEVLARPEYLDLPAELLLPSLTGRIRVRETLSTNAFARFIDPLRSDPDLAEATRMVIACSDLLGKPMSIERAEALAASCFVPPLHAETFAHFSHLQA